MKKLSAALLTTAIVLAILSTTSRSESPVIYQDCYCQAPDDSCSVSISCAGGCIRFCGNSGDCSAECSGFYSSFALETSFELQNGTYAKLTSRLAQVSATEISFTTNRFDVKPDAIFNVGFKRASLWDGLELLANRGTVRIAGKDFESYIRLRQSLLGGTRINFGVKNTPVSTLVNDLSGITGLSLRITKGKPMTLANVELAEATLDEIIAKISEQTGTTIVESGEDVSP
jgi:hypothetical protein